MVEGSQRHRNKRISLWKGNQDNPYSSWCRLLF